MKENDNRMLAQIAFEEFNARKRYDTLLRCNSNNSEMELAEVENEINYLLMLRVNYLKTMETPLKKGIVK